VTPHGRQLEADHVVGLRRVEIRTRQHAEGADALTDVDVVHVERAGLAPAHHLGRRQARVDRERLVELEHGVIRADAVAEQRERRARAGAARARDHVAFDDVRAAVERACSGPHVDREQIAGRLVQRAPHLGGRSRTLRVERGQAIRAEARDAVDVEHRELQHVELERAERRAGERLRVELEGRGGRVDGAELAQREHLLGRRRIDAQNDHGLDPDGVLARVDDDRLIEVEIEVEHQVPVLRRI
jgi:hypothetical protein